MKKFNFLGNLLRKKFVMSGMSGMKGLNGLRADAVNSDSQPTVNRQSRLTSEQRHDSVNSARVAREWLNGSSRLRVVFYSFTCRLRVCPLKLVSVLAIMLTLGVGNMWGADPVATLSFTKACGGTGTDSEGNSWTISSDVSESTYSSTQGIHYGTNDVAVDHVNISTTAITSTVSQVVVEASRGGNTVSLSVSVGGTDFKCGKNTSVALTTSNASYTFTGSASGTILVHLYKPGGSATKKAIYCKSVSVTHAAGSTKTLVYDANGATGGSVPTDATAYNVGDKATVIGNTGSLYKIGHTFAGWTDNSAGTGTVYVSGDKFTIASSGNKLYAKWTNTYAGDEFTLVEDLSDLSAGSKIVILDKDHATALSTEQGSNNRTSVAVTASPAENTQFAMSNSDKTVTLGSATTVQVITLEDLATPASNTYQFNVENGYLYAAGSGSGNNYLRTQTTNDANGHWLIGLSSGTFSITAKGTNTNNLLKKNSSNTFFSCYSTGQKDVLIYVKEEGTKYAITWDKNGHGTAPTSPTSAAKVTLPELSASGWQHTGWKADKAVTNVSTSSSISAGTLISNSTRVQLGANTTFTAQWKQILAAPTFTPSAGTYNTAQTVELSCETVSGCTIRYTTDGSTPTTSSGTVYSSAISVNATTTIKAIAYKDGYVDSEVSSGTFTLKCAALTFDVAAGTYTGSKTVTISGTDGATIRYTTDGSTTPSSSVGTVYSTPITVDCSQTIKAIAYKTGWSDSDVKTGTYHINYTITWKVDKATYTPGSGGGGGTSGSSSVECGNKVSQLPTDPDPAYNCGDKFMGWTTTEEYSDDEAPDDLFTTAEDSPEITDHTTFYAVFADYGE